MAPAPAAPLRTAPFAPVPIAPAFAVVRVPPRTAVFTVTVLPGPVARMVPPVLVTGALDARSRVPPAVASNKPVFTTALPVPPTVSALAAVLALIVPEFVRLRFW